MKTNLQQKFHMKLNKVWNI